MGKITVCLFFFFFFTEYKISHVEHVARRNDWSINGNKIGRDFVCGHNGPVSPASVRNRYVTPPPRLHPLNDRQLKDAWVTRRPRATSAISQPRGRSTAPRNPPPQTSTPAVHCRYPGIAGAGVGLSRHYLRRFDFFRSRGLSFRDRFQFLRGCGLLAMRFLNAESVFFFLFSRSLLKTFPFEAKLEGDSHRSKERVGRTGSNGTREISFSQDRSNEFLESKFLKLGWRTRLGDWSWLGEEEGGGGIGRDE